MKHFKVKFLVFISAIFLFFGVGLFSNLSSMVVYAAPAEGYTETGACGTSAYWYYYEDTNTLLIDGSGALNTYSVGSAPWYSYRNSIKKIEVSSSITSMGAGLFSGMSALEELTIPFVGTNKNVSTSESSSNYVHYPLGYMFGTTSYTGGVQVIQNSSKDYVSSNVLKPYSYVSYSTYYIPSTLKTVNVTNSTYIFSGAFSYIYSNSSTSASLTANPLNITTITLNEGIKGIGVYAFGSVNAYDYNSSYGYGNISNTSYQKQYSKLETINLPSTLLTIDQGAFYNCQKLDSVEIPGSVTTVGNYAFYNCKKLSTEINSGTKTIGNYAFYGCSNLDNQTFPGSVTSIGNYAYYSCTSFTEINLPSNITSIGDYAFGGCNKVEKIQIEEGLKTIGTYAFKDINKVTNLIIPTTVTSMGAGLFSGMSALEELTIPFVGTNKNVSTSESSSNYVHYPLGYMFGTTSYTGGVQVIQNSSKDYVSSNVLKPYSYVSYSTYYIPSTLKTVNVTNSTYIFSGAFSYIYSNSSTSASLTANPLNITTITLNEGIKGIGVYAFGSVNAYDYNSSYGYGNISNTSYQKQYSKLETINLPSTLLTIDQGAFYNCQKLDSVEIPGSVTTVGNYAFYNCKVSKITVLKQSTSITVSQYTFTNVPTVKYFDYYSYTNGNNTFYYNVINEEAIITKTTTTNTDLTLPTTLGDYPVTKVANMGVANCTSLTSVVIPANIVELGNYAFSGCTGLTTVTIPATCLHVGDYAFNGCTNITTTTIAEGVKYVGDYAFFNCKKLQEIVVPDTCEYLGQGAFYNCI